MGGDEELVFGNDAESFRFMGEKEDSMCDHGESTGPGLGSQALDPGKAFRGSPCAAPLVLSQGAGRGHYLLWERGLNIRLFSGSHRAEVRLSGLVQNEAHLDAGGTSLCVYKQIQAPALWPSSLLWLPAMPASCRSAGFRAGYPVSNPAP